MCVEDCDCWVCCKDRVWGNHVYAVLVYRYVYRRKKSSHDRKFAKFCWISTVQSHFWVTKLSKKFQSIDWLYILYTTMLLPQTLMTSFSSSWNGYACVKLLWEDGYIFCANFFNKRPKHSILNSSSRHDAVCSHLGRIEILSL